MERSLTPILPVILFMVCAIGLAGGLLVVAGLFRPARSGRVARMPYESGMDPIHDTRRRFDVRFHLLAIAFLIFDVELLFLYPWAVCCGEWRVEREAKAEGGGRRAERVASGQWLVASDKAENEKVQGSRFKVQDLTSHSLNLEPLALNLQSLPPSALRPPPSSSPQSPAARPHFAFFVAMTFVALLTLGFVYDWRKGVFQWR